ncbi:MULTISPECIES: phage portal protein [unclassified Streptococcus]|uniref:phage portal protein n=3 Tax=Streptococcus TaxID=1301 RepID=UPI00211B46B3|nr:MULTISPECIES: phage portal protein [unclassified Streptococcus]MCQ9211650.1 phage portal protein [Streptococcus sp. B01]MCQ9213167.1 phage portal protein [Streptococcus sp. O1]MCQ9215042.1 phage portal protein [Streptococcus sp. O1]
MNLIDKIFRRNKTPTIKLVDNRDFSALISDMYIPLDRNPDVQICVNRIADLVSNMTIYLMENTERGDRRIINELSRKIDIEPCQNMTRKNWVFKIVQDLLLNGDGNSIVHVSMTSDGYIKNLTPFSMNQVSYRYTDSDSYTILYNNQEYQSDEVLHFAINPDPENYFLGRGYRPQLREIVANLNQATKTKSDFMRSRSLPNLIIKVDAFSEKLQNETGREELLNRYFKASKAGEPLLVSEEMFDIEQVKPLTLKDIAINESVEIDKKTVAGIFGVPAFILGIGSFDKDEYNNFITNRIMSLAQNIAQTLTRDLLMNPNWYFKFNSRALYAYNLSEIVSVGIQMIDRNAMRRNELRGWIDLPPDEEMEELLVLENYLPAEKLGDQKKLKGVNDTDETSEA